MIFSIIHTISSFPIRNTVSLKSKVCPSKGARICDATRYRKFQKLLVSKNSSKSYSVVSQVQPPVALDSTEVRTTTKLEQYFERDEKFSTKWSTNISIPEDQPSFFTPMPKDPPKESETARRSMLPLMLFLPGIDSTGMNAVQQFPSLLSKFDLKCFSIPLQDRSTFMELVEVVESFLRVELEGSSSSADRPVYLFGESFGGLLALAVAHRCPEVVHRVVLVNPATSFPRSPFSTSLGPQLLTQLPQDLYTQMLPLVLSSSNSTASVEEKTIPKSSLDWRLQLMKEGSEYVEPKLTSVLQRFLVVCSENDRFLPSSSEATRLTQYLPRCTSKLVPNRGHALLQESGFDISQIIEETGFYATKRVMTSYPAHGIGGRSSRGLAGPVELPTPKEIENDAEGPFNILTALTSPMYFSTCASTGRVTRGLEHVPFQSRPLIFIGNHQFLGLDSSIMIVQILQQKNVLIRGLAHPFAFWGSGESEDGGGEPHKPPSGLEKVAGYGAVPVTPRNMYQLLGNDEAVLLYPGGAREGFKNKGEEYKLIWPSRPEVIRMAARFNATIIPVSAIGLDDGVEIALDGRELSDLPIVGEQLRQFGKTLSGSSARKGVAKSEEIEENFVFPLPAFPPKLPGRLYFLFGKPIHTNRKEMKNDAVVQANYDKLKTDVEEGIQYLLKKRKSDPYDNFVQRVLYEASNDWKHQAPTFDP